jgi:hypothetical protein
VAADPEQQVVVDVAGAEDGGLRVRPGDDRPAEDGPYLAFNRPTYSSAYHDANAYHDAAVDGPTQLSRLVGLPDRGAPRALAP